jgi:hypothetical protein
MSLKSMAYDNPSYVTRQSGFNTIMTAGSGGVSSKFVAFANLLLFSLTTFTITAGSSTYTNGLTGGPVGVGTAGPAVAATQLSMIRITNTASAGATVALSTSTIGPFTIAGDFLGAGGTATNQIGASNQFSLNTATGTAGLNGLAINAGDQFYFVNGTDASAVELIAVDYQIQPLANVTA